MKRSFQKITKKTKRDLTTCSTMNEKRAVLESVNFADAETRVPKEKPPLRFALEESNLSESNKVEFALRDDVKAFLEGRSDPKKKSPSGMGMREVKVYQFSGGTTEDLILWTSSMMKALAKKPCETPESKFSTAGALLRGEAAAKWKEHTRACANKLARSDDTNVEDHMVATCCNEQSFKATLKKCLKSCYPACAGRTQMNYMSNHLKKVKNARQNNVCDA